MDEGIHVVRLVLVKKLHGNASALGSTVGIEHLIGRVVIGRDTGIKTVQGSRGNEDLVVGHDLDGCIPASSVELRARLNPILSVQRSISGRTSEETETLETIADGGIHEVQTVISTDGSKATISKENTTRAEGVGLVGKRSKLLVGWVILRGESIATVGKLELSVVLDLVKENDAAVGQETSVHSRDTGSATDDEVSWLSSGRCRAGTWGRNSRLLKTRSRLASVTAVRSGATAVSVHGAAGSLRPVSADGAAELSTAGTIGGRRTLGVGRRVLWDSSWGTKNRLAGSGG